MKLNFRIGSTNYRINGVNKINEYNWVYDVVNENTGVRKQYNDKKLKEMLIKYKAV